MDYKYQGIILNKRDVAETDRIYTIYTLEAGKIRVLGKGVRRPNAKLAGNLEPLTYAEIFVARTRGLGKITGSIVVDNFSQIKTDLSALTLAFEVFRLVEKNITDQEEDAAVFNLLLDYLRGLEKLSGQVEESANKKDILTLGFLFKLLVELGYRTETQRCVCCESKLQAGVNHFSASRGGILCGDCSSVDMRRVKAEDEAIKCIRIFLQNRMENLAKLNSSEKGLQNLRLIARESFSWIASGNSG